jgi:sterol desaturase/sphingolipid hydroxylase (fatty acid hydroxylase superfamily)
MKSFSWLLSVAVFPLFLVSAPLAAYGLFLAGVPASLAVTLSLVGFFGLIVLLERWFPYREDWNHSSANDVRVDLSSLVSLLLSEKLVKIALEGAAAAIVVWSGPGWFSGAPLWGQVLLALFLGDVGKYWVHRLSHERPWLWSVHLAHHTPDRVYSLNGLRFHPFNAAWNSFFDIAPALLLGLSVEAVIILGSLRGIVGLLQHANLPIQAGVLGFFFSNPAVHRWHHARAFADASCNYGATLMLWDRVWGTYRSAETSPAEIGIASKERLPTSWMALLLWPFCQERLWGSCFNAKIRTILR